MSLAAAIASLALGLSSGIPGAHAAEKAKDCAVCAELRSEAEAFAALPASTEAKGKERAARETKEDDVLKQGGLRIAELFRKGRKPAPEELDAAAVFFAKTAARDRRGVAADWMATTIGKGAVKAANRVRDRLAKLAADGKISAPEADAAKDRFRVQTEETETGQN